MNIPMREKYVDEAAGIWFIFGEYPDGRVDVSDANHVVFSGLPRAAAEAIVSAQERFRRDLYSILCGVPK